jgi:Mn-dependent DtxR family transcriptional regulator
MLSDDEIEKIAERLCDRVTDRVFAKLVRRMAKVATMRDLAPPSAAKAAASANAAPKIQVSPHVAAAVTARLARKGVY